MCMCVLCVCVCLFVLQVCVCEREEGGGWREEGGECSGGASTGATMTSFRGDETVKGSLRLD